MRIDGNEEVLDGYVTFFPVEFFCPKLCTEGVVNLTENSYTIHHFSGSWLGRRRLFVRILKRYLGNKFGYYFDYFSRRPDIVLKNIILSCRRKWYKLRGRTLEEPNKDPIQKYKI